MHGIDGVLPASKSDQDVCFAVFLELKKFNTAA